MESERVHRWLLRQAGRRGPVLEIGSWHGALSVDLARCAFRAMSAGHLGPSRPPISEHAGRLFRSDAGRVWTRSEMGGRHAEMSAVFRADES